MSLLPGSRFPLSLAALGLALLVGCSSSDDSDDDGNGGGQFNLQSLAGNVRAAGGTALPGVTVAVGASTAMTDVNGDFIIPSVGLIPSGQVTVEFDGTTSTAPGSFPLLDVIVDLEPGVTAVSMPQVITLPDLMSPDSGEQNVALAVNGATTAPISVVSPTAADIAVAAPTGTIVTIGGVVGAPDVDINVTPVPPMEVPMPLPNGMLGGTFVTIQPSNAAFDTGAGLGLDFTLPNTQGLPVGSMIDIWSFDHDAGAWVNRSQQTGQMGTVVDNGGNLEIQAQGVILEGGWHTAAIQVDTDCSTTFAGHVEDAATGDPIKGASIALSTGQFGVTNTLGDFSIPSVPAYDTAALAVDPLNCLAQDLTYEIVVPPAYGSVSTGNLTVPSAQIMSAGTTAIADVQVAVPTTGALAGLLTGDLNPGELVLLTDSNQATSTVAVQSNNTFIKLGLAPGAYTASYLFPGTGTPTTAAFTITANTITTINIQFVRGQGTQDISVLVMIDDDNESTPMMAGDSAQVLLVGSDAGSSGGLLASTDVNGLAEFADVSGPYTVTVVKDVLNQGSTTRHAASLIDINPTGNTIGVLIEVESDPLPPTLDATLSGTVSNMPTLVGSESIELFVEATGFAGDNGFNSSTTVDPTTGAFTMSIPSGVDFDLNLVHADFQATSPMIASMVMGGVTGTAPAGTLTQDFDFGSSAVIDWDQPVSVTFTNALSGATDVEIYADLFSTSNGFLFASHLYGGPVTGVTLNLPDFSDPNLAGLTFGYSAEIEHPSLEQCQECSSYPTTNPTSHVFDFQSLPTATAPFEGAQYTLAEFESLAVSYTEGASGLGANGLNFIAFENFSSQSLAEGNFPICWTIYLQPGATSFSMPGSPLPLFQDGETLGAELEQVRFAGYNFNYNGFFGAGVEQNLSNLFSSATTESAAALGIQFSISSPN